MSIYLDNAATSIHKPKALTEKFAEVLASGIYGSPGRSGHSLSQNSMLAIYQTKKSLAKLFHIANPNDIALTENATFGLNFVIRSLIGENDHVITSTVEHNSVLRPLYQTGSEISFMDFDKDNKLKLFDIDSLVKENTRFLLASHASNILGKVNDLEAIYSYAKKYDLTMIVDMAQTAGCFDIDLSKYDKSIFVFTGHKSLYGPPGTGGIIKNGDFDFRPVFSGGSGVHSFDKAHPADFPNVFEIGTSNYLSQIALGASVDYLLDNGLDKINAKLWNLTHRFYQGVKEIGGVKIYSSLDKDNFSPMVSLNIGEMDSAEVSLILDEDYDIQTRPGAHCAPLVHKHFGTEKQGIVRFSFSYFNEKDEIDKAIEAVREISEIT